MISDQEQPEPYIVSVRDPWPALSSSSEEEDPFVERLAEPNEGSEEFSLKEIYTKVRQRVSRDQSLDEILSQSENDLSISETRINREPLQLVRVDENGHFEICKKGAMFLKTLRGKIGVVSIGGPARCGKSFILNCLVNQRGSGFEVGNRVASCTQGI